MTGPHRTVRSPIHDPWLRHEQRTHREQQGPGATNRSGAPSEPISGPTGPRQLT